MIEYMTALRAVSAAYAKRIMVPVFLTFGLIIILLFVLTVYLGNEVSGWWWLLIIPAISFALLFAILCAITSFLLQKLNPPQSPDQRKAVKEFVDKLEVVTETVQTPRFLIFIYMVRDTFTGSRQGFLQQITSHSKSLKNDFERLMTLFRPL